MLISIVSRWLAVVTVLVSWPALADGCYRVATYDAAQTFQVYIPVLEEAYARAGMCVDIDTLPLRRAERALATGTRDGNLARTAAFVANRPDVVAVPVPLIESRALVLRKDAASPLKTGEVLAALPGVHWAKALASKTDASLIEASPLAQLLELVDERRVDGILLDSLSFLLRGEANQLDPTKYYLGETGVDLRLYHVVHKKHRAIVPRLAKALTALRAEGEVERILDRSIAERLRPTIRYDASGSKAWYPYILPGVREKPGIVREMVRLILDRAGFDAQPKRIPRSEVGAALRSGDLDIDVASPSWFPGDRFPEGSLASVELLSLRDRLYFAPGQPVSSDLKGRKVGVVAGYSYHDAATFTRVDFDTEADLVRGLADGTVSVGIMADLTQAYWGRELGVHLVEGPVHSEGRLVFRLPKRLSRYLSRLNSAILESRADGSLQKIVRSYIGNGRTGPR